MEKQTKKTSGKISEKISEFVLREIHVPAFLEDQGKIWAVKNNSVLWKAQMLNVSKPRDV